MGIYQERDKLREEVSGLKEIIADQAETIEMLSKRVNSFEDGADPVVISALKLDVETERKRAIAAEAKLARIVQLARSLRCEAHRSHMSYEAAGGPPDGSKCYVCGSLTEDVLG